MRLVDKIAVVIGAGQSPGEGMGNGRATVPRFAQEGAKVLAVDRDLASAEETAGLVAKAGGTCVAFEADVTREATLSAAMAAAQARWGRLDILHYNVGVSIAGGDAPIFEISEGAFDRLCAINLRGAVMACKHALPIMRAQRAGVIIAISSAAAWEQYPNVAYKATKAAMVALTQQIAIQNAAYGIRANVILPDGHPDGGRHPGARQRKEPGGNCGATRRAGAAARPHGHRLGRRQCGPVSCL